MPLTPHHAREGCVHIIGAGVAGMAAALALREAGRRVIVHEAARFAGGRARSFHDPHLNCTIDNGTHLILAANHAVLSLLDRLGTRAHLKPPPDPAFFLFDRRNGCHITLRIEKVLGPLLRLRWQGSPSSCTPRVHLADYLKSTAALFTTDPQKLAARLEKTGPLWRLFWEPFIIAVLNTPPNQADPAPLRRVLLETFGRGADALLPLLSDVGLSGLFADPFIERAQRDEHLLLRLSHPVRAIKTDGHCITALIFDDETIRLNFRDCVILAVPPWTARRLLPAIPAPDRFSPIVNVHFRLSEEHTTRHNAAIIHVTPAKAGVSHHKRMNKWPEIPAFAGMTMHTSCCVSEERAEQVAQRFFGVIDGTAQWIFRRGPVISVTVSAANTLQAQRREDIARACWRDVTAVLSLAEDPMPPVRVIAEKRATFLCTPAQSARRPPADVGFSNLFLAGDWVNTGLPATLESAARSGETAARLAIACTAC